MREQLRHGIKRYAIPVVRGAGVLRLLEAVDRRPRHVALNYHNVAPRLFASHLAYLSANTELVTVDDFLARPLARASRAVVTLTFDDGYAAFVRDIVPLLRSYRAPATWFVTTALVDGDRLFWFDRVRAAVLHTSRRDLTLDDYVWRLEGWNREYVAAAIVQRIKQADAADHETMTRMVVRQAGDAPAAFLDGFRIASRADLRALDPALVTVGSHSHTHPELSRLGPADVRGELATSRRCLEEWTGRPVHHFAFPSGNYDRAVVDAVAAAGYASAWTTECRFRANTDDVFRMPRVPIDDHASLSILAARLTAVFARW